MLCDDADDPSHASVAQPLPQLAERGVETAAVTDRQHDSRLVGGVGRGLRARAIERDRLFHQNVFSRRRRSLDLLGVLTVRCGENDGVDAGIGQDRVKIVHQTHAFGPAEIFHLGARPSTAGNKTDVVGAVLHRIHQRASPTPQSNDGCADHVVVLCRAGFMARKC